MKFLVENQVVEKVLLKVKVVEGNYLNKIHQKIIN